jgi:hypothetical protein
MGWKATLMKIDYRKARGKLVAWIREQLIGYSRMSGWISYPSLIRTAPGRCDAFSHIVFLQVGLNAPVIEWVRG